MKTSGRISRSLYFSLKSMFLFIYGDTEERELTVWMEDRRCMAARM